MTHVGDVHHALDVIAGETEVTVEDILHDIGAQISDVRVMVHRGSASVHTDLSRLVRDEVLFCSGE